MERALWRLACEEDERERETADVREDMANTAACTKREEHTVDPETESFEKTRETGFRDGGSGHVICKTEAQLPPPLCRTNEPPQSNSFSRESNMHSIPNSASPLEMVLRMFLQAEWR